MEKYLNPMTRIVSLTVGAVAFGAVTGICACCHVERPYAWGMIVGASAALLTLAVLALVIRREWGKLQDAGERVGARILCFVYAALQYGDGTRMAYVFLTAERVHFYLWDKKPYLETAVDRVGLTVTCASDYRTLILHSEGEETEDDLHLYGKQLEELAHIMYENGYCLSVDGGEGSDDHV